MMNNEEVMVELHKCLDYIRLQSNPSILDCKKALVKH